MTIDDKIVYHRKRLGLTQKQLADYLGITVSAVQMLEYGKSKEPTYILLCFCLICLGVM